MKFRAEATFADIPLASYEELYFDDPFNQEMCNVVKLERTLLKKERVGNKIVRHTRVAPIGRELPGPVAKAVGASRIEYVEEITYDFDTHTGVWRTVSSILPDKVDTKGTLTLLASGDGCTRISEGTIDVKVFGIGGLIEKIIVGDVDKSYEDAARFTREYWARKQRG
jgi:hypothetical protein